MVSEPKLIEPIWKEQGTHSFVKGDILRCKINNPKHPQHGKYAYGVCSGDGFGCHPYLIGAAIFMDYWSWNLADVLAKRKGPFDRKDWDRWERYFPELMYLTNVEELMGVTE